MDIILIVSIILLIIPIFDWLVFSILFRATGHTNGIAIAERAKVAGILAIVTTLNAILGANRVFALHIDPTVLLIILSISLLLVSIPNLYWLSLYLRSKIHKE